MQEDEEGYNDGEVDDDEDEDEPGMTTIQFWIKIRMMIVTNSHFPSENSRQILLSLLLW